jgi:hypothetical protein
LILLRFSFRPYPPFTSVGRRVYMTGMKIDARTTLINNIELYIRSLQWMRENYDPPAMETPQNISKLLQEQYTFTEEYANSQSRLLNASMTSSASAADTDDDEIKSALNDLNTYRNRVRSNLERLHQGDFHKLYPAHVALSQRVIQTIASNPSWHPNGLHSHVKSILETNTVALATLKASIDRINEMEKARNVT